MKRKVCIVTPDLLGAVKNGGIGTHCYWLAKALARDRNLDVTIFYTGPYEGTDAATVSQRCLADGITFVDCRSIPAPAYQRFGAEWFIDRGIRTREFLEREGFDAVHFQDWHANGFISIQAKRTGLAFRNTLLTVTMHSCSAWVREGSREWPLRPVEDAILDYCERYAVEHADAVVSPSRYMVDWAAGRGWKLPTDTRIIQNCFESPDLCVRTPERGHLAFFGRIEGRKGIEIFCSAVDRIVRESTLPSLKRVTFLGKKGTVGAVPAEEFLSPYLSRWKAAGMQIEIADALESGGALRRLAETGATAVVPSLHDNLPYSVLECAEIGIPLLATAVGGIPELVPAEALCEPTSRALKELIESRRAEGWRGAPSYSALRASGGWRALTECSAPAIPAGLEQPLVSVCIPYFNCGKYLEPLLASIAGQDYANFEVILIDDGSTDPLSVAELARQRERYSARGWRFESKANEGLSITRNRAASLARGDLLMFVDADNIAAPGMISKFVRAIAISGADCVTCYFRAFKGDEDPGPDFEPEYSYHPVGGCIEAGLLGNVFGDANCCVRKAVFGELGGFHPDRTRSYEDWEFFARLLLRGFTLDTVPEPLFFYRHLEEGFSRRTDSEWNHRRVVDTYVRDGGPACVPLITSLLVPLAKSVGRYAEHAAKMQVLLDRERIAVANRENEISRLRSELQSFQRLGFRMTARVLAVLDSFPACKSPLRAVGSFVERRVLKRAPSPG